eukprot:3424247-Rhodomonas_salina.1
MVCLINKGLLLQAARKPPPMPIWLWHPRHFNCQGSSFDSSALEPASSAGRALGLSTTPASALEDVLPKNETLPVDAAAPAPAPRRRRFPPPLLLLPPPLPPPPTTLPMSTTVTPGMTVCPPPPAPCSAPSPLSAPGPWGSGYNMASGV